MRYPHCIFKWEEILWKQKICTFCEINDYSEIFLVWITKNKILRTLYLLIKSRCIHFNMWRRQNFYERAIFLGNFPSRGRISCDTGPRLNNKSKMLFLNKRRRRLIDKIRQVSKFRMATKLISHSLKHHVNYCLTS